MAKPAVSSIGEVMSLDEYKKENTMKKIKLIFCIVIILILLGFGYLFNRMHEKDEFIPLDEYNERYSNEVQLH